MRLGLKVELSMEPDRDPTPVQGAQRFRDRPWRRIVQAGPVPMTVGLVAASAALITEASDHEWILVAVTVACALASIKTRLHPLWLLAAGAIVGWSGIGQF